MPLAGCSSPEKPSESDGASKSGTKAKTVCSAATQTPNITTVGNAKDNGCGGTSWKVWFDLPAAAGKDGWVIQEIDAVFEVKNADGSTNFSKHHHYWEAWPVSAGKKVTEWQDKGLDDNDDEYGLPSRPGTKGTITARGTAKFVEGPLPPDFVKNNPDTAAGILPSTTHKPACWDGSGQAHHMDAAWDCTGGKHDSNVSGQIGVSPVAFSK